MCGFTGVLFADPREELDLEVLGAMAGAIERRGPDDESLVRQPGVGLGFRRLSILDLEGGRQPFVREGGQLIACTNGEIYNFRELRAELEQLGARFETESDCEVVPAAYLAWGPRFVERLEGMFAFCVFDLRPGRNRLLLGRDRLGIKPLYFGQTSRGLWFGSEPKALLASGQFARELRPESLLDYLVQGYCGGESAAFAGMQRLAPGHLLEVEAGGSPAQSPYWRMPLETSDRPADPEEILENLDARVAERRIADVPLGAFLSGGIDSTAVVDSMARSASEPVIACSIGFRERSHNELDVAKATAERLGLVHHTHVLEPGPEVAEQVLPWLYDEPHADPSNLPTYLVSLAAREHVTVALSGDGGDETFAGYRRYVHDSAENRLRSAIGGPGRSLAGALGAVYPKFDRLPRVFRAKTFLSNLAADPARAYWRSVTQLGRGEVLGLLHPDVQARLGAYDPFDAFEDHYRRPTGSCSLYRAQYADLHTYLPDQILAKVDRASMGVGLEVRVPILDHRFVERFATLPASEKIRGSRGKHAFREALRSRIPGEVLDGTKRGFDTPLAAWFRGPLADAGRRAVADLPDDWFDRPQLERVLAEHQRGARDHGRLLWSLLVLARWRERHGVRGLSS